MPEETILEALRSIEPDKVLAMTPQEFEDFLVKEKKLFGSTVDFKLFVLENLQNAYTENSVTWPIEYREEPLRDPHAAEGEIVEGEMLTDEFAEGFKSNGV